MIERLMRWITKRYIMGSMAHECPDRRIDLFQMLHEATAAEFTEDNTYTRTSWLKEMIVDTDPRQGKWYRIRYAHTAHNEEWLTS